LCYEKTMRGLSGAVLAGVCLHAGFVRAGDFATSGDFAFSKGAAVVLDFETEVLPPLADPAVPPPERREAADALSGRFVLALGEYEEVAFRIELPQELATYRASLWVRGGEAVGSVRTTHGGSRTDEVATLYPTGRMTSDGWVELANEHIVVDGARGFAEFAVFATSACEVDALELVRDGTTVTPPGRACSGIADAGACDAGEVCTWGACRRVTQWVPPLPPDREAVTEYLANRLRFLFGPYANRTQDLPAADVAIEAMRGATDPWTYWNGFLLALRRLHDSHTSSGWSPVEYGMQNPRPLDVCFIEGDADWSHAAAPRDPAYRDVLVSHAGALRNLGLKSGDRLVRVDGRHPIDWARSTIDVSWSLLPASNHSTFASLAASLRGLISRYAQRIEVVRCDSGGCGAVESLDVSSLAMLDADETYESQLCDNRPSRHVPGAPKDHRGEEDVYAGFLDGTLGAERLFGIEWDSLYTTTGQDGIGPALKKAVQRVGIESAKGVVFDHRRGTGGTLAGPKIVWDYAVPKRALTFFQSRERAADEQPSTAAGKALFSAGLENFDVDFAGTEGANPVPTALLITDDMSASDWLPLGMKGAPHVRIFGPYETSGAFSTRLSLGYWMGLNYTLASGDSFVADGRTLNGHGVPPDEEILPKQSDLAQGKDTVYEAALAWLRAELGGAP
jgi:hypothetical protein